jgi:transcriptional regulator with XRE-family HTH domain
MTAKELQRTIGDLREEMGISKYQVAKDGVFSSGNAVTRFERGEQTAQLTTIAKYLDYLGYKLEIVPK